MIAVEIYSTKDSAIWDMTIKSMFIYDFYSLSFYHSIAESQNEGRAVLFVYKEDKVVICMPFLVRPIDKTIYCDITSVYGYSGPLSNIEHVEIDYILRFQSELNNYFNSNKIISVFSRLHPLMPFQNKLLQGIGNLEMNGATVSIDLTISDVEQRYQYRKSTKSELNRLKKADLQIYHDRDFKYINDFMFIYHENMLRVGASNKYLFDLDYFNNLINSKEYSLELYFVEYNGVKICGSLFTFTSGIIQYHLSGTLTDYFHISPTRLLIDYIRTNYSLSEYKYFHLGGGVGGSCVDSLFIFKSGFSKIQNPFFLWKYIVDKEIYDELVKGYSIIRNTSFFPLYRSVL